MTSKSKAGPIPTRLAAVLADAYQIQREIGSGGMATVYLARDVKHDREVALKVLRPELAAVLGAERFLNEIRITARLDHPHILTLIDSGAADGFLYYVLPFVRGESLRERMEKEKQLSLDEALKIAQQVASALDYADRQGVVHRDIKPENILIQEGEAILADFGIALAVKEAGGDRLTETGLSLGTPHYMSPEQATGDRQLDARSDVYSLGAVLYEMIAGEPPHSGPSVQAVIAKLITERPTKLRVLRDTVPQSIEAAVAKALAKVPADRYATAGDFAKALDVGLRRQHAPAHFGVTVSRPLLFGAIGLGVVAVALLGVLIGKATRGGGRGASVALRDRSKLTSSGRINLPSISADGKYLAYVSTNCAASGCTHAVEFLDVGGGRVQRVFEGATAVYSITWSPDRRNLLIGGTINGRPGLYLVPELGGTPRLLPSATAGFIAGGDSLLLAPPSVRDGVAWLRVAGLDAVTKDSIRLPAAGDGLIFASAIPNSSLYLVGVSHLPLVELRVIDRQGNERDRKTVQGASMIRASADAVWLQTAPSAASTNAALIRIPVQSGSGKFSSVVDTVDQGTSAAFSVSDDGGKLVMEEGTTDYQVWALDFRDAMKGSFATDKPQLSASSPITAYVSPDGQRLLVRRELGSGQTGPVSLAVAPFAGGNEVPLPVKGKLMSVAWTDSVSVALAEQENGKVRFVLADARTGNRREEWAPPDSAVLDFDALPSGGWVWIPSGGASVKVQRHNDAAPHVFRKPDWYWTLQSAYVSPDGKRLAYLGYNATTFDSLRLTVVSLADSSATPWITTPAGEGATFGWLSDGSLRFTVNPTVETQSVYRLPTAGSMVWQGTIPRSVERLTVSRDLKRATVNLKDYHADAWMIKVVRP